MTRPEPPSGSDPLRERLQRALGSHFALERELGGGMSRVFLAEETALNRKVVVKVLSTSLTGELSAERFAREIRVSTRLQHPGIVPVPTDYRTTSCRMSMANRCAIDSLNWNVVVEFRSPRQSRFCAMWRAP